MVRALLRRQGVPVPPEFPVGLAGRDLDALRAASAVDSVADFLTRLDDPGS